MFLPKKHADLPIEPSVLESLRAQEKSLKREKRKAAKERRQHAKQLKKAEKHAKKRIAARKAPQKASDCLQYLSMSQDGICEVEPGLFSMTMAFTDVNFQIAMLEEQKNIFTKYSEFLNYFDPSLHLEINLVTRSMDEEQFRRDTFLPLRGNDRDRYAEEMNQVVAEKALRGQNGLIREKYVTFSLHAENYQHAKEQLENRAADIADHFKRMGSSTRILSGIERLSLLQGIMRPNEEMSFSYDWLLAEDDLTTKDFISPSSYNWHPEHDDSRAVYRDRYQFGDKIGKSMYLRGIAPEMKNGLFSMLSELPFDHVITMHVDAMDQAEAVQEIEKKLAYMHKEEYDAIAKARERNMPASIAVSYDLKSKMHHTEQMMDDITTKNQKIFKVCILIHTYGDSNAQLVERVRRICSTVQQQTCRFDSILYEQRNAMNSMLPLGKKWLGLERTLEIVSTAIYVPFTTQELFQPGGLYEGINARSKNLILCNRKLLPAPAGMVLGMTGYGKSFSVMQMVTNIMLRWPDDDIVLIDPEQEYTHLVTAMGGVVIDISASSPSHINPMDITEDYGDDEDPIRLKSQFLQNFCQLILHSSELSPQERTFIDVAAGLTYQRYMANPKREEMPTLHDFYRNLALQGEEVKPLLTALKLYVSGSMDLFAHQTNVNVQNHCICFNTVKLGKSMQSIGMLTVLDQVWNRITRNRVLGRRTWVFTDEFQQLLGNKDCTDFYFQLSSRARKWGAILTSITQHVRSVLDNEDARRMLSDCGYIKLLNQSPDDANDLARLLHISNEEKRYIENAEVGSGLLIVSKTVVPFNNDFPKDTELFRLMDTSPNRMYKAVDLDGTWVPADALGDGFTLAGLENTIKNKSEDLDTNHSTPIAELYQELTTNYPQSCDTSVRLTSRQICSAGKRGVLLQIHDSSGNPAKLMIDNSHIHTAPDGSVSADIGAAFSYDITYDDGTHGTIRGADLIRQIDEANLTQPLTVSLTADQIMAMSLRGVTVHLPQYHIERLFIPERHVQRNVEQGSCAISLYPGWQYSYVPIGSEKTRKSISGAELAQSLGGVVQVGTSESSLARRVANVERRTGIANAQELGKLLGSMADNGLHSAADFDKQISTYQREEMKLRNEIAELRSKSKIYAATAHNLQACRTYKSVWLEYASKPLAQKDTFYNQNEAALQAYSRAASQLDKMGISLGTEPEKVRQLVAETESRIADLIAELEMVRKTNQAIQEDKEKVEQIQSG